MSTVIPLLTRRFASQQHAPGRSKPLLDVEAMEPPPQAAAPAGQSDSKPLLGVEAAERALLRPQ